MIARMAAWQNPPSGLHSPPTGALNCQIASNSDPFSHPIATPLG
jgi:hypothetical protein